tara:strand:- start:75 stop:839 length:765 start_codon:yes stop_codon:yes gene_type:complete
MKTYRSLISELNKYEKETVKMARQLFLKQLGHKKYVERGLSKNDPLKAFERSNREARSNPRNPFVSPRRESENVIGAFQDTEPGQKGRGNRVDPETGRITKYDPTKARHNELRGVSKKKSADIQKLYKTTGDKMKSDLYKNIGGSQNRRIYQPAFSGTELERAAKEMDMFPKTNIGSPTTRNIPKGKIPEPPIIKPSTTFKPPKGSVGAMRSPIKPKTFKTVLKALGKNKRLKLGALAVAGTVAGVQALRNRKN